MFLDTSAIVEYFIVGPDYDRISRALSSGGIQFYTSPTVMFEAACVLASRRQIEVSEAVSLLEDFLSELRAEVLPATRETGLAAIDAFARYGKGRHPAKLNFGDCFSYAGARAAGSPLLYVGNDFAHTDLA
ncbi:type II toxin-antitoxin system VapC family toxin [Neorhizobium lilium]|uniref:Ribonuclease VapC n=1 Tax=Neorhizobium lilium TaxID=2503024 RepID=A0A444LDF0_9HYPH|nr:type II toxin-antitoxin system VapC family toxin [Neorhizobium lilium]RWX75861.1 type II toxin-antitoxin system VapC family toxin [Neorhizobium lilium]